MANFRIDRIGEEMRREISEIIHTVKDPRVPEMLTITGVKVTSDLSYAQVFVSAYNSDMKEAIKGLSAASGYIKHELMNTMKIRKVPELRFEVDASYEHGMKIYDILKEIDVPKNDDDK